MTNGKGILDVKLKHIVSRVNLSMASNLCLSDSRVCHTTLSNTTERDQPMSSYLRIHVHLSNKRLGFEGLLGKSNGIRGRQDVFGFLEGVVHFRRDVEGGEANILDC